MSNLKHQTLAELKESKRACLARIDSLKSQLAGQNNRLEWIDKYIFEKSAQELTIEQIEARLGHRVIIK